MQALRAQSLHRKLREIGTAQGPEVQIVGQQLVNFSSDDYLGWRVIQFFGERRPLRSQSSVSGPEHRA